MAIRLASSCTNCINLENGNFCSKHNTSVSAMHTCDGFTMKAELKDDPNCGNCSKFESSNCANPEKSAIGMLCSQWSPQQAMA